MKLPLMLFCCFWNAIVFAQETVEVVSRFNQSKQIRESYHVLKSIPQTKHGRYVYYFQMTQDQYKSFRKGNLESEEFIKTGGTYSHGKKNGEWVEYSSPYKFKTKGKYENGKKTGVWQTSREGGQVIEHFDFDQNKKLPPFIQIYADYPAMARENGLQGTVTLAYLLHPDCSVSDIRVTNSLSSEFDKSAIAAIKRYGAFLKIYGVDCQEKQMTMEVKFRLD
jgi:TonB family protein